MKLHTSDLFITDVPCLTKEPIDIAALFAKLHSPGTGGIVMFSGEVRGINKGKEVSRLEYEAYEPMAIKKITEIVEYARKNWELNQAICVHRLGRLEISDCAILVLTASAHRGQAYEANRYIIDHVKMDVPIWKKECYADGTHEWGANSECSCAADHRHVHNHQHKHHHHQHA